jgi:membrane associated rhomboid family serine protease
MVVNWTPGGAAGARIFRWFTCEPGLVVRGEIWRLLTAGLLSQPDNVTGLVFTCLTIYFFVPTLESSWGTKKILATFAAAIVVGNVLATAVALVAPPDSIFGQPTVFGTYAPVTALCIAWALDNPGQELRLFFFLPLKARHLFWFTVGICVLRIIMASASTDGVVAPFGGILVGWLVAGSPSPLRRAYLKMRLGFLRGERDRVVEAALRKSGAPSRRAGSPDLRVVRGGADDDDKPDKRYLN